MKIGSTEMPKLGFGLMRLPNTDGIIDMEQLKSMVDAYMKAGHNYFDTAYVYHGGKSETAIKEALTERYPRESYSLATKLPAWAMQGPEDRDKIFNEQLDRAGVEYFDFYLLHSLEDGNNSIHTRSTTASTGACKRKQRAKSSISVSPTTARWSCWRKSWTSTRR